MVAIPMPPNTTIDELCGFADFMDKVLDHLYHHEVNEIDDPGVHHAIDYWARRGLAEKLLELSKIGKSHEVYLAATEMIKVINEVLFVNNLYSYVVDRYKVDLHSDFYAKPVGANIDMFHDQLFEIANAKDKSYEDGYQLVMRYTRAYWLNQGKEGNA